MAPEKLKKNNGGGSQLITHMTKGAYKYHT